MAAPRLPVKVGKWGDRDALQDSASMVALIRPEFAEQPLGPSITVSCIHCDARAYPTFYVEIQTTRGKFVVKAGVENLIGENTTPLAGK